MAGIYIHIPFCRRKCNYCNFFSIASIKHKGEMVKAICKEAELRKDYLAGSTIDTIYFGGGTPSMLKPEEFDEIFKIIDKNFNLSETCEISLECNPDDLNKEFLYYLKNSKFNRLSIGVQSFRNEDLLYLERNHDTKQALTSIENARKSGFENISIDLIFGMPTLNSLDWESNLKIFSNLSLPHLSSYALTVEPNTILSWQINKNKIEAPVDQSMVEQFEILMGFAEAHSYEHYEISNFARNEKYSRHNTSYWNRQPYLGLGPSAHSFDLVSRQWNIASVNKYIMSINNSELVFEKEVLSEKQKFNEYVLTALRTKWGIDITYLTDHFTEQMMKEFYENLKGNRNRDLLIEDGHNVLLTNKGKLFADGISAELFIA